MGLALIVVLAGSLGLTPLAARLAWFTGAVRRPDGRRRHLRPTALLGGLALYAAMLLGGLTAFAVGAIPQSDVGWWCGLALSATLVAAVGLYDDLHELAPWRKLLGEALAIVPVLVAGGWAGGAGGDAFSSTLGWFTPCIAAGWLLLMINAVNLVDGMDGLAAALTLLSAGTLGGIAAWQGDGAGALLAALLAMALIGFLVHNRSPASIYLGDSGSLLLGLLWGLLVLRVARTPTGAVSGAAAVGLTLVPLVDTVLAVVRRLLQRRSVFSADCLHAHHQLLGRGMSEATVLTALLGIGAAGLAGAVFVLATGQELWGMLGIAAVVGVAFHQRLLGRAELRLLAVRWQRTRAESGRPLQNLAAPAEEGRRAPRRVNLSVRVARRHAA